MLDSKIENGQRFFKIKWLGYALEESTWEPMEHILDHSLVDKFLNKGNTGVPACAHMERDVAGVAITQPVQ